MGTISDREVMLTIRVAAMRATIDYLVCEVHRLGGGQGQGRTGDPIHPEDLADIPLAQRAKAALTARALHFAMVGQDS